VILLRNSEVDTVVETLSLFYNHFNQQYKYPILIFHEQGLTDNDKRKLKEKSIGIEITFYEFSWCTPSFINVTIEQMLYDYSISYRHMCRFFGGKLFQHPALLPYRYYWRLDATSHYITPIHYDLFEYMEAKQIVYGFNMIFPENIREKASGIWDVTQKYLQIKNYSKSPMMDLVLEDNIYTTWHFWDNFEIVKLSFYRDSFYQDWFELIDNAFGIYTHRWGDAPIHSVAVLAFIHNETKIHYFDDIGYEHLIAYRCPPGAVPCPHTKPYSTDPCTSGDKEKKFPMCIHEWK